MISIEMPDNYIQEREYVLDVIFNHYLGLKYGVCCKGQKDTVINLDNKKRLIIRDHLFSCIDGNIYCDGNLPKSVYFSKNAFAAEDDVIVIYGNDEWNVQDNQLICGIDLVASIYFMLTRWEETLPGEKDIHDRFPAARSIAYQNKYIHRPVVNEWVEMLWNILKFMGLSDERKLNKYKLIPTHDVDHVYYKCNIKNVVGDVVKRRSPFIALRRLSYTFNRWNPYDTFDHLMQVSEKNNLISRFYMMSARKTKYDSGYSLDDRYVKDIIKMIVQRGHVIGFHPGYDTYRNPKKWKDEHDFLQNKVGMPVVEGRQHYVRFSNPSTWQTFEENGMELDSTMTYPEHEGFRCGTGNEYPVYDILNRKKMNLVERPAVVMEGTLWNYRKLSLPECKEDFDYYKSICMKYEMPYTVIFHNSSFDNIDWNKWKELYSTFISG